MSDVKIDDQISDDDLRKFLSELLSPSLKPAELEERLLQLGSLRRETAIAIMRDLHDQMNSSLDGKSCAHAFLVMLQLLHRAQPLKGMVAMVFSFFRKNFASFYTSQNEVYRKLIEANFRRLWENRNVLRELLEEIAKVAPSELANTAPLNTSPCYCALVWLDRWSLPLLLQFVESTKIGGNQAVVGILSRMDSLTWQVDSFEHLFQICSKLKVTVDAASGNKQALACCRLFVQPRGLGYLLRRLRETADPVGQWHAAHLLSIVAPNAGYVDSAPPASWPAPRRSPRTK